VLGKARLQPTGRLRIELPTSFGRLKIIPMLGAFRTAYTRKDSRAARSIAQFHLFQNAFDRDLVSGVTSAAGQSFRFAVPALLVDDNG
jgi:hypothetical protein